MNFKVYIAEDSIQALGIDLQSLTAAFQEKAKVALQMAAAQAHGFIVQEVQSKLKGSRKLYLSNLVGPFEKGDNVWVVALKSGAKMIEDGFAPYDMIPVLTKGPKSKVSKEGYRYNVIPFSHSGKSSSDMSHQQAQLAAVVKTELKKRGLDRIIKDEHGKPLSGKVATVHIGGAPWSRHNTPLLSGLSIYQKVTTNDETGKTSVRRDIMTFRTVSEKQAGTGKWFNKGYSGIHVFDKVEKQVDEAWNKMINDLIKE